MKEELKQKFLDIRLESGMFGEGIEWVEKEFDIDYLGSGEFRKVWELGESWGELSGKILKTSKASESTKENEIAVEKMQGKNSEFFVDLINYDDDYRWILVEKADNCDRALNKILNRIHKKYDNFDASVDPELRKDNVGMIGDEAVIIDAGGISAV